MQPADRPPAVAGTRSGSGSLLTAIAKRPRHELEFLPAALEIIETPAPPAAHLTTAVICAFCVVAVAWSTIGRVDIVANAPGTIIPGGKVKFVQPLQTALVTQVLVADGDRVAAGQPVMQLDSVTATSDRDRLAADLAESRLNLVGLSALRAVLSHPQDRLALKVIPGITATDLAREEATITARRSEQAAKLADFSQQMAAKRVEAVENANTIDKLRTSLPMIAGARDMYQTLFARQLASRIDLLSSEQKFSDTAHDLVIQIAHGGEIDAALNALSNESMAQQSGYTLGVLRDLTVGMQKLADAEAAYRAAAHQVAQTVLYASASGTVQQLSVHGAGTVVTPAERLMVIVPDKDRLMAEAMVDNRDIGFVHLGQQVNIKVGAFSFSRYGMLTGHVITLSRDSMDDRPKPNSERSDGMVGGGSLDAGGKPDLDGGEGSGYAAQIMLDRDTIEINGHPVRLTPGMSVTAEIITGRRRVINYLLSPLLRVAHDAGRER